MASMTDWGCSAEEAESRYTIGRPFTVRASRGKSLRSASTLSGAGPAGAVRHRHAS